MMAKAKPGTPRPAAIFQNSTPNMRVSSARVRLAYVLRELRYGAAAGSTEPSGTQGARRAGRER